MKVRIVDAQFPTAAMSAVIVFVLSSDYCGEEYPLDAVDFVRVTHGICISTDTLRAPCFKDRVVFSF